VWPIEYRLPPDSAPSESFYAAVGKVAPRTSGSSAEMTDTSDCYAMSELLIFLLANTAMIGLIRLGGKSKPEYGAYFLRSPTTIFCGTVIFRGWAVGSGQWEVGSGQWEVETRGQGEGETRGERVSSSLSPCLLVSPFPTPIILYPKLLMKTCVAPFYPCPMAGPYRGALLRGINCVRLVRRRDESLQCRVRFCRIF
jgi:hypothetical protein